MQRTAIAGFVMNGDIWQGKLTQRLLKDLEDMTKEHFVPIYARYEEGSFNNTDKISVQYIRTLPNSDGMQKNNLFIEAVRYILGLPSHILQPFAEGHHFIGRDLTLVDAYDITVKNAIH